jgi:hypothetical protein
MKTYNKTVKAPMLEIRQDFDAENPRNDINLGYFITCDSNMHSPDKYESFEAVVKTTGDVASSQEEHIKLIKKELEEEYDEKVLAIYPITKYEHSGISYSLGNSFGFDYSNNGFYIITEETAKEVGVKEKDFEKVIENELDVYNKYVNGEVYSFTLFNKNGEVKDSCGGFYNIGDIRECLTKGWDKEDLNDYLIN